MKTRSHISSRGKTRSIFIRVSFGAYELTQPVRVREDYTRYENGRKYRRIEYYTGITVKPEDWEPKKGITRNNSYLNGQLQRAHTRINEIYHELAYHGNLTYDNFKNTLQTDERLNGIFKKSIKVEAEPGYVPPMEFIENYIKKAIVSDGTKKDYNNTLTHLKDFDDYRGKTANWKAMGYEYYLELVDYLKTEKYLKASTIDKIIKNLKVFLQQADLTDNLEVNQDFKKVVSGKSLFAKVSKEEPRHIYLTEDEIKQFTNAEIEDKRLSEIRDLFIIGCWTGLRISDLSRLRRENIKDGLVSITTKKTSQNLVIPVTDELQAMLDKYPEQLPKIPTDQHFNRELKKAAKAAKLDDTVMSEVKKGNMKVKAPVPKHELITSHTARRSFATNLYRRGIPSTQLMMLTGHKTEDAFLRYIKVSKEDNAKDVAKRLKKIG